MNDVGCWPALVRCFFLWLNILGIFWLGAHGVWAATIVVNTTDDSPNQTTCSLRNAIRASNSNTQVGACSAGASGLDTILLPAGLYVLTLAGQDEDQAQTGDLDIREALVLRGAGRATTIIDGSNLDRIIDISTGITVTLDGLTIQHGSVVPSATQGQTALAGGAIYNAGLLTLSHSAVLSSSLPYSATVGSMGGGNL